MEIKNDGKFRQKYCLSCGDDNEYLNDRINWADEQIKNLAKNNENYFRPTVQGEVRSYTKKNGKTSLFLVLEKTNHTQPTVLICPIYAITYKDDLIHGYRIGVIPSITTNYEFIAAISEIRFAKKDQLEISNSANKPICYLMQKQLLDIFYLYRSLIDYAMNLTYKIKKVYTV